jgi:hypothetical protein
MAFDLTEANPILKEDYLPPVREQLNNDNFVIKKLTDKKQEATGKRFYVPLHYGRNNGVGYRAEGGTLPTAGNQKYKESTGNVRYLYGRIEITGPTMYSTRNDKGAFLRALDSEMKGLTKDLKDQRARAIFGDGTGKLGTFSAHTSVNTLTVDKVKYFQVGMKIDIVTSGGVVSVANREVTAINKTAKTITISGAAVTTAATDFAVVTGDYNIETMGIGGIMSQTLSLQGIDPATDTWWKPSRIANGGTNRAVTEALMRQAMDLSELEAGEITLITASYGVRASYESLLQSQKRFVNPMELEGGHKALEFDGKPIIVDRYHESNRMEFIDLDEIDLYQMADFDWMEKDGSILSRVSNKDAYEATMFCYETLVTYKRNAHTELSDITEPSGY